jgi:HAD superfamily hydrolase (TIGR01490 family)
MALTALLNSGIDFFDVDRTVIDGASGVQFIITAIQQGILSSRILLSIPKFYWQYRFGEMDFNAMQQSFEGLKGISREVIFKIGVLNFENRLKNRIFGDAENMIKNLHSSGRKIAFVTSSFNHVVQPLAQYLSIDFVLSNSMEYKDGTTTGFFHKPFLFGEQKKYQTLELIHRQGVTPENCSFYSDSITDLPLLEAVGKPVAVNADAKLKKVAEERGWQIVRFR